MCGIIGYVGKRSAVEVLLEGLKRLEYRGYDSAGIACFDEQGKVLVQKSSGRLENLEKLIQEEAGKQAQNRQVGRQVGSQVGSKIKCGIGHTRWATHGKPSTENAHPHQAGPVTLVHNGVIENYLAIKQDLLALGYQPRSETDSELFAFLVADAFKTNDSLIGAVRSAFRKIKGQCSFLLLSEKDPSTIIGLRYGSPLVVALDPQGGAILASDSQAILPITREVTFLEQGDLVVASQEGLQFYDLESGLKITRKSIQLDWALERLDKQGYPHYMLKEIFEQPEAISDTLRGLVDQSKDLPFSLLEQPALSILREVQELTLLACGSSWHAALLGKYWIEYWARIPVRVDLASEFRYCNPVIPENSAIIGISQSGETADTLAALRQAKEAGFKTIGITNVRGSTLAREVDAVFYTCAGPEIGVASTKAFLTQLLVLVTLAGNQGFARRARPVSEFQRFFQDLLSLPKLLAEQLSPQSESGRAIQSTVLALRGVRGFFFMGRGYSYPIALEGALKLKEIAYDHAEGFAAGELKHGPIAMIDQGMAVLVFAPRDPWRDKTLSNLEEVKARGAIIIGVGEPDDHDLRLLSEHWLPLGTHAHSLDDCLMPFFLSLVVQLFSYHRAVFKGTDVDRPRNLAKSVTVE